MFGLSERKVRKLKDIINNSSVEYNPQLKLFKIIMIKNNISPEHIKKMTQINLEIDEIVNQDNGQLEIILKERSHVPRIVMGVLTLEVLLFSFTIFVLLSKTGFR